MNLIPNRFLFRVAYPCRRVGGLPRDGDELLDLPQECRIDNFADMDGRRTSPTCAWRGMRTALPFRWSCAARNRRRSATPRGRVIPTAFRCGSTRATPAPATAPAGTVTSSISCRRAAGRRRGAGLRPDEDQPSHARRALGAARRRRVSVSAADGRMAVGGVLARGRPSRLRPGTEPAPRLLLRRTRRGTRRTGPERRGGLSVCGRSDVMERSGAGSRLAATRSEALHRALRWRVAANRSCWTSPTERARSIRRSAWPCLDFQT